MADLKAIGSEKLTGQDKIKRIMEIATYGETTKNVDTHISTNHFSKKAANGVTYSIIKEKDGYYVKSGLNESSLDYVDGLHNKKKNRFTSYSSALKRLNLMLKPINETYNNGRGDSLYEQSTEDEEKFVLKSPNPAPAPAPAPAPVAEPMGDEGMDIDMDVDMGGEEMDVDVDMGDEDMGDEDMGGEESWDEQEQTPTAKSIQKLTGKLGQKMREFEDEIDSDMIKYVLNSIISAIDLDVLDEDDRDDIISRLEPEEDEYGMEDEFEVDADFEDEDMDVDMDVDMDMGDEDMDVEMEDSLEESLKNKVKKTLKKYYRPSKREKLINEDRSRKYINKTINKSYRIKHMIGECDTLQQELTVKKVLKRNSNFRLTGRTKKGTLVLENKGVKLGVNKRGKIIN